MKTSYTYLPGTIRARRYDGSGDVRGYRPPKGWEAEAVLVSEHPLTGRSLTAAQWWIIETRKRATDTLA